MTKVRKAVSSFVGGFQCFLGGLAAVFAFIIYVSPSLRETLSITFQEIYLYMFTLLVFSAFSTLSGLLLIRREKNGD
jgi:hypothetical protein